jgi:maltose O-acetyltransferase
MKTILRAILISIGNSLPLANVFSRHRYRFYRLAGIDMAKRIFVNGPILIAAEHTENLIIGAGTFLNLGSHFGCPNANEKIRVGQRCALGPACRLETVNHGLVWELGIGRGTITKGIVLEDEVWLGAGVTVLPGVRIGEGSVIAAGAVVTKDVPAGVLAGGVPCKVIRELPSSAQSVS